MGRARGATAAEERLRRCSRRDLGARRAAAKIKAVSRAGRLNGQIAHFHSEAKVETLLFRFDRLLQIVPRPPDVKLSRIQGVMSHDLRQSV